MKIDLDYVKDYKFDTTRLDVMVKDGYLIKEDDRYVLTESGIKFIDKMIYIAMPVMMDLFFEALLEGFKNG